MKIWIPALVTLLLSGQSSGQECASDGSCDTHERCPVWRDEGECYRNEVSQKEMNDNIASPGRKNLSLYLYLFSIVVIHEQALSCLLHECG